MNERTEQLYKEAVDLASAELHEWNKNWQPGKHTNFEYEKVLYKKFAELIVRECLEVVEKQFGGGNGDGVEWDRAVEFTYNDVKQHFGVEE